MFELIRVALHRGEKHITYAHLLISLHIKVVSVLIIIIVEFHVFFVETGVCYLAGRFVKVDLKVIVLVEAYMPFITPEFGGVLVLGYHFLERLDLLFLSIRAVSLLIVRLVGIVPNASLLNLSPFLGVQKGRVKNPLFRC